jgi:hypothetical protein
MDPVNTISSAAGGQQPVIVQPAPEPVLQAVPTELSGAKAVTASDTSGSTRNDTPNSQADYQHTALIDPATREVIYRVVDVRSGQIVSQIPEQAQLRLQAYARALANGKSASEAMSQADLQA